MQEQGACMLHDVSMHACQSFSHCIRNGGMTRRCVFCCSGKYPPIPDCYSRELKALVDALIKREPNERLTLEVLSHTWLKTHGRKILQFWSCKVDSLVRLQEVLQLEVVRKGLSLYWQRIASSTGHRESLFETSRLHIGEPLAPVSSHLELPALQLCLPCWYWAHDHAANCCVQERRSSITPAAVVAAEAHSTTKVGCHALKTAACVPVPA